MIIGIGTDIVEISRIRSSIERYGDHFLEKIFTATEIAEGKKKGQPECYFAGRWAAKESASKALGTGFGDHCRWLELEITNGHAGNPILAFSGETAKFAKSLGVEGSHVSISHERAMCVSTVVLEKM